MRMMLLCIYFYSCRRHPHTPIQRRHGRENGECVWVVRFCSARRMASPACASAAMLKGSRLACFRGGVKNGDRHTRACIGIYICEHKTALAGMEGTCIWLILCLHFGLRLVENSVRLFMVAQLVSEPLAPYFVVTLFRIRIHHGVHCIRRDAEAEESRRGCSPTGSTCTCVAADTR